MFKFYYYCFLPIFDLFHSQPLPLIVNKTNVRPIYYNNITIKTIFHPLLVPHSYILIVFYGKKYCLQTKRIQVSSSADRPKEFSFDLTLAEVYTVTLTTSLGFPQKNFILRFLSHFNYSNVHYFHYYLQWQTYF